jgi:NarL family two-component system response regulator LiaR
MNYQEAVMLEKPSHVDDYAAGGSVCKTKILLADDHMLFREGLRRILEGEEDMDCVGVACDGEEALKLAQKLVPHVALIDIAMPKLSGIEVAKKIKATLPQIAVLILSAYKHDGYVIACMQAGVNGYLLKDMSPRELINAIRMVRAGEGIFSLEATSTILKRAFVADGKKTSVSAGLHNRELEVLRFLAKGMSNKQIANELCLSVHTVRTHLGNIFKKLGVSSRTEALSYAVKQGWLNLDGLEGSHMQQFR